MLRHKPTFKKQSICTTRQCITNTRQSQITGELTQENSQHICKANLRKKRFVSRTKVLRPLIRSKTASSKTIGVEPITKRENPNVFRPCASTIQDNTECEACKAIVNSKNFIKTLRHCSSRCFYHRELDKLLQKKINDLKRRKWGKFPQGSTRSDYQFTISFFQSPAV